MQIDAPIRAALFEGADGRLLLAGSGQLETALGESPARRPTGRNNNAPSSERAARLGKQLAAHANAPPIQTRERTPSLTCCAN